MNSRGCVERVAGGRAPRRAFDSCRLDAAFRYGGRAPGTHRRRSGAPGPPRPVCTVSHRFQPLARSPIGSRPRAAGVASRPDSANSPGLLTGPLMPQTLATPSGSGHVARLVKDDRRHERVARGRAPQSAAYERRERAQGLCTRRRAGANRRRGGAPGPARPVTRRHGIVFQQPASLVDRLCGRGLVVALHDGRFRDERAGQVDAELASLPRLALDHDFAPH